MVDIDDLKTQYLDNEFDRQDFILSSDRLVIAATTSGEKRPQYVDPDHPDFQATPAFLCSLASGRHLPIDFPALGGVPMDGGKAVECFAPVRPETKLTGKTHLHDIYDKKGRSGRMIFIVVRLELFDDSGEHLATTDSRLVIQEK